MLPAFVVNKKIIASTKSNEKSINEILLNIHIFLGKKVNIVEKKLKIQIKFNYNRHKLRNIHTHTIILPNPDTNTHTYSLISIYTYIDK